MYESGWLYRQFVRNELELSKWPEWMRSLVTKQFEDTTIQKDRSKHEKKNKNKAKAK